MDLREVVPDAKKFVVVVKQANVFSRYKTLADALHEAEQSASNGHMRVDIYRARGSYSDPTIDPSIGYRLENHFVCIPDCLNNMLPFDSLDEARWSGWAWAGHSGNQHIIYEYVESFCGV